MRTKIKKSLKIAFVITTGFFVIELVAGFLTNSLALLSDAGHMITDVGAILMSLVAFKIAESERKENKTYGFYRAEIISAFINGQILMLISIYILYEAIKRLNNPPEVKSLEMLIVAVTGLGVNVISALILHESKSESLNVRSAYLHVIGDALGSIGAISAGTVMLLTGWMYADIIASLVICAIIIYGSIKLLKDAVNILMEGAPAEISVNDVNKALVDIPGVSSVHDLHIWTLTSGKNILTAHIKAEGELGKEEIERLLEEVEKRMRKRFKINHITIQLEPAEDTENCNCDSDKGW